MNILLKSLDLVHFKCFNVLHLDFHEGVNNIYGETPQARPAFTTRWRGCSQQDARGARPDIKPHHAPAGTMPEVTAVLEVDGEPIKLRKVLREKWEKPRGSSIERYAGDTRDYYIDDVPLAENEYKAPHRGADRRAAVQAADRRLGGDEQDALERPPNAARRDLRPAGGQAAACDHTAVC